VTEKIFLITGSILFVGVLTLMITLAAIRVGKVDFQAIEEITEVAGEIVPPEAIKEHGLKVTLFYTMKDGPISEVYKFQNLYQASYFAEAVKRRMLK